MKIEDYSKYYIQGSDHYLIPKDVFDELFDEMVNWKEETKELKEKINGVDEERTYLYNKLSAENEQLNSLVNSCQEEIRRLKKQLETYEIEGYGQNEELNKMSFDIRKYKVQQKEFIKFLEDNYKETKDIWYIKILQKYKSTIGGVSNE